MEAGFLGLGQWGAATSLLQPWTAAARLAEPRTFPDKQRKMQRKSRRSARLQRGKIFDFKVLRQARAVRRTRG
jgi:hypothetical protein